MKSKIQINDANNFPKLTSSNPTSGWQILKTVVLPSALCNHDTMGGEQGHATTQGSFCCLATLLSLAACGSVIPIEQTSDAATGTFDARPMIDAFPALDEDNDGVADATDNCPWIANASQSNGDADALGDTCDPSPSTVNTFRFYSLSAQSAQQDPFQYKDPGWTPSPGGWLFNSANAVNGVGVAVLAVPISDAKITIGINIAQLTGAGAAHNVVIALQGEMQPTYYYGEFYQAVGAQFPTLMVTYTDGINYTNLQSAPSSQAYPTGPMTMSVAASATKQSFIASNQSATGSLVARNEPSGFTGVSAFRVELLNMIAELQYIAIVE
jgi:hypothetical protein